MNAKTVVRAFAPGSVGNIGPGLDIMGLALTGPGDTVEARVGTAPGVTVADAGHPDLPVDRTLNTAALAAAAVAKLAGKPEASIEIRISKGLPLSGGQGGSAASAVAGAVAANALLGAGLSHLGLLEAALAAEMVVAGTHLDNILPSLLGGIVLVRDEASRDFIRLRVPDQLRVVLAHPAQQLKTKEARSVLPATVSRADALYQAAQVAAMTAAFVSGELGLLRRDGVACRCLVSGCSGCRDDGRVRERGAWAVAPRGGRSHRRAGKGGVAARVQGSKGGGTRCRRAGLFYLGKWSDQLRLRRQRPPGGANRAGYGRRVPE